MIEGLRSLQSDLGVDPTGSIRPGGPEEAALTAAAEGGSASGGGTVHVHSYTQERHGNDVRVVEHTRSAPGGGQAKQPHNLGDREVIGKSFRNAKGNTECVELIKQALGAPPSSQWQEGARVEKLAPGQPDPIPPGTPIATFENGKYPQQGDTGMHAGIYMGQDEKGIQVLDQWRGQKAVAPRTIYWAPKRPGRSNDGNAYSVIEW